MTAWRWLPIAPSRKPLLPLGDVRPIEGSPSLGGKAISDEQIDRLMLPRIETTRHLWQLRATEEIEAVR